MKKFLPGTKQTPSGFWPEAGEDDRRLVVSSIPVIVLFSLLFLSEPAMSNFQHIFPDRAKELTQRPPGQQIYPVLVEQLEKEKAKSPQIRALSNRSVEGRGGLTQNKGFHTLTQYDTYRPGSVSGLPAKSSKGKDGKSGQDRQKPKESKSNQKKNVDFMAREDAAQASSRKDTSEKQDRSEKARSSSPTSAKQGEKQPQFKIPANYRFQQDFLFRYDDGPRTAVATRKLAGFDYFQSMLRQIRESFAPPGLNYAYRDQAGTVVNQPIKPQTVKVLFSMDHDGFVRDVRVVSSMGQAAVDRACVDVLSGQNFGKPPPEIFENGHIFGINFIFPPVMR